MIEFCGLLTGSAERYFHKKSRSLVLHISVGGMLVFLPTIVTISIKTELWMILFVYCTLLCALPLLLMVPKDKEERISYTPKRIVVEDDTIVAIADKYAESRLISDAKVVRDHGEFYEIIFPFGKISDKFICQKDLLTKGTLETFEALFEDRLEKLSN